MPLPVLLWCTTNVPELPSDIVDIKPPNMEDLTEVITAAEFHPRNCSDFLYSTSKGVVRLCDMRERALCDQHAKGMYQNAQVHCATCCMSPPLTVCPHYTLPPSHCLPSLHPPLLTLSVLATPSHPHTVCPRYTLPSSHCLPSLHHPLLTLSALTTPSPPHTVCPHCVTCAVFEEPEDPANRSFFSEIIASISDVKFSHCGRYFLTRDFLTLKLWDLNMERAPLETYHMHDYLRSKLCSLYENDFIFDRFECGWNGSDRCVSWVVRVVLGRCGGS